MLAVHAQRRRRRRRPARSARTWLLAVLLVGAGIVLGSTVTRPAPAWGEPSLGPPGLKSGGQLSLPVLQDILSTLRQIDGRLAKLEATAKQMQMQRGANR